MKTIKIIITKKEEKKVIIKEIVVLNKKFNRKKHQLDFKIKKIQQYKTLNSNWRN